MAGNRFGTWKKRTAAVFMAVCLLGAMPGAVWAADTADGLESSISDSETKKQELEQKNAELSQALEEAKQNAEDQEEMCIRDRHTLRKKRKAAARKPGLDFLPAGLFFLVPAVLNQPCPFI